MVFMEALPGGHTPNVPGKSEKVILYGERRYKVMAGETRSRDHTATGIGDHALCRDS